MEGPFIPATGPLREIGVVANDIEQGLGDPHFVGLGVLRLEQHLAAPVSANLVDKLGEAFCVGQVHHGAGLAAVAVTTGDDELVPALGQLQDCLILFPAAQAAEFESVNVHAQIGEEPANSVGVARLPNVGQIPQRVVQYDQDVGVVVQAGKQLGQVFRIWVGRKGGTERHDRFRLGAGQIVHAEMKDGIAKRNVPFHRRRNRARFGHDAKQQRRSDAVVVGKGNQAGKAQLLFDLLALQAEGSERRQGWSPVGFPEIQPNCTNRLGAPVLKSQCSPQRAVACGEFGNEVEALAREVGVAVQGNRGPVGLGGARFFPKVVYFALQIASL